MVAPLFLIGIGVAIANQSNKFTITLPVKFKSTSVKVRGVDYSKFHEAITSKKGEIHLGFEPTWQNNVIAVLLFAAAFATMAIVGYQVKEILESLRRNEPFNKRNFHRVRIIAFMLIGAFISEMIFFMILERTMLSLVESEYISLESTKNLLWAGLIMLVLEAVFKRGTYLEEEEKLTI